MSSLLDKYSNFILVPCAIVPYSVWNKTKLNLTTFSLQVSILFVYPGSETEGEKNSCSVENYLSLRNVNLNLQLSWCM